MVFEYCYGVCDVCADAIWGPTGENSNSCSPLDRQLSPFSPKALYWSGVTVWDGRKWTNGAELSSLFSMSTAGHFPHGTHRGTGGQ